jgi:hypothetical protein
MVHAARASAARAMAPPSTRHFLIGLSAIKNARNSPENNALNFSNEIIYMTQNRRYTPVGSVLDV